jgi:DNA-binding FadR family transcriptional regulator
MGLIRNGSLRLGDRLPTHADYAAILGASNDHVRYAYRHLMRQKLVGGHKFLGHFVIANANHPNLIDPPPKAK